MSRVQLLTRTVRQPLLGVLLAAGLGASAQTADPVAPFVGTWSGVFTTQENEYWTFADIQCFVGCAQDFYDHLSKLLADPANDDTPAFALSGESSAASVDASKDDPLPSRAVPVLGGRARLERATRCGVSRRRVPATRTEAGKPARRFPAASPASVIRVDPTRPPAHQCA